jgi:hypothetical protein
MQVDPTFMELPVEVLNGPDTSLPTGRSRYRTAGVTFHCGEHSRRADPPWVIYGGYFAPRSRLGVVEEPFWRATAA